AQATRTRRATSTRAWPTIPLRRARCGPARRRCWPCLVPPTDEGWQPMTLDFRRKWSGGTGISMLAVVALVALTGCGIFESSSKSPTLKGDRIPVMQLEPTLRPAPELAGEPVIL